MVSAESFHGEDAASVQQLNRFADARFTSVRGPIARVQVITRSTVRARNRLRVKTAVARILIFCVAVVVQTPILHRSVGSVVRQTNDNRIARTAVGAVDVGIPIAPVSWVKKFLQASIADREVRRNANCRPLPPLALTDSELIQAYRGRAADFDLCDASRCGRLCFQVLNKSLQLWLGAFQINLNPLLAAQHPSRERVGARETIHVRTKANALHHAANSNRTGTGHRYSTSTMQLRPCHPI